MPRWTDQGPLWASEGCTLHDPSTKLLVDYDIGYYGHMPLCSLIDIRFGYASVLSAEHSATIPIRVSIRQITQDCTGKCHPCKAVKKILRIACFAASAIAQMVKNAEWHNRRGRVEQGTNRSTHVSPATSKLYSDGRISKVKIPQSLTKTNFPEPNGNKHAISRKTTISQAAVMVRETAT